MEIEDENQKLKILTDNISTIFAKEIEKLIKCIDETKLDFANQNNKLIELVEKLENSLQQYELVFYESDATKKSLKSSIDALTANDKIINYIARIKNPNEIIYELLKIFNKIVNTVSLDNANNANILSGASLRKSLDNLLDRDLDKETLDVCLPFTVNYNDFKSSVAKINANFVIVLDVIKYATEFNLKRNILKNLYDANLNKNAKLNALKEAKGNKEVLIKAAENCLATMQGELTFLLVQKTSEATKIVSTGIIHKYEYMDKYKIALVDKTKVTIKLKSKFRNVDVFVKSIVDVGRKEINIKNLVVKDNVKLSYVRDNKNITVINNPAKRDFRLNLNNIALSGIENASTRSRNINNNLYFPNTNANTNTNKISSNNISNPSKVYYATTERANKSIGSTLIRDVEALESIIRDDKDYEVVPIENAIKPIPKMNNTLRGSISHNANKSITNNIIGKVNEISEEEKSNTDKIGVDRVYFVNEKIAKDDSFIFVPKEESINEKVKSTKAPGDNKRSTTPKVDREVSISLLK